ncbi:MAG TPA: biotin carboxylase N-terminal domain-containing protein [Acidimicrobiia bacterium]|nr:biotin carboxylase N-terminal domain-containing protein [Acidimicrobiia bacterium]
MIRTVLVANRGEIARRVFRTCREMGIRTLAVFSDADRHAPFVTEADDAFALGGSTSLESYLNIDVVLAAAERGGADAVHPGYGFLAENADFARAVQEAGLVWIGPSPEAIATMGSKLASKRLVREAGVPTLPSVDLSGMDDARVSDAAEQIGYPVLVKASAGGGGKGMRIVATPTDLVPAVRGAEREASASFGDGTVFLEKYLIAPRHVEIQVFGDHHGNLVSLHERECSIQRRHQKIVEEAPSPAVGPGLRAAMGEAAVSAARAVGYTGAGTVEFLLVGEEFHFLEMNTRLQVEHPVTEAVTGLDLVRLQILVADGHPLPREALDPALDGHAIEVRLYAEDARNEFLPAAGHLTRFEIPLGPGLRIDSGVESGSDIPVHYDPMLAKVIAHAPTREEAAARLAGALHRAHLHGSVTNRDLLVRILRHPEFLAGETDTGFLDRHDPAELARPLPTEDDVAEMALAAALAGHAERRAGARVLATIPSGWRNNPTDPQVVTYDGPFGPVRVSYRFDRGGAVATLAESEPVAFDHHVAGESVTLEIGGRRRLYRVAKAGSAWDVDGPDGHVRLVEHGRFPSSRHQQEAGSLQAPMPGKVLTVLVKEGDAVSAGQSLLVMEAMKMEHTLRSPVSGVVTAVRTADGDQVEAEASLITIQEDET